MDYKDKVKTKEFRYPPILPVVYHEGSDTWTAPMHLKDRIFMHEIFEEYIPDFTYCLVNNHKFSNKELLERKDEINRIVRDSPEAVIDIIVMVMQALCTKLNLSRQDTDECVKKVRTRNMGYLWANMEQIDVQAAQAELSNTKTELAVTQARAQDAETENAHLKALLAAHGVEVPEA